MAFTVQNKLYITGIIIVIIIILFYFSQVVMGCILVITEHTFR